MDRSGRWSAKRFGHRTAVVCLLSTSACGRFGPQLNEPVRWEEPTEGPAVELLSSTLSPGCFSLIGRPPLSAASNEQAQLGSALRQMLEFEFSYHLQISSLVASVVSEDPTALRWSREQDTSGGRSVVEGESKVRKERWGELAFWIRYEPPDGSAGTGFEDNVGIRYSGSNTRYEIDDATLVVTENLVELVTSRGRFLRGCDPRSGMSIELLPEQINGVAVPDSLQCWLPDGPPWPEGDSREEEEFRRASRLQCAQLLQRLSS